VSDEVKDLLASVSADIDQAQATIDEGRRKYPDDVAFQQRLNEQEFELELQRLRVKNMRNINRIIDP